MDNPGKDSLVHSFALLEVALTWIEAEGAEAVGEIYNSIKAERIRRTTIGGLIRSISFGNPAEALSVARELPAGSETDGFIEAVFRTWTEVDSEAAFSAASELDALRSTSKFQLKVIEAWAQRDPVTLLNRIGTLPPDLVSTSKKLAVSNIAREAPKSVMEYVENFDNPEQEFELTALIVQQWTRSNPKATLEWLLQCPIVNWTKSK